MPFMALNMEFSKSLELSFTDSGICLIDNDILSNLLSAAMFPFL